MFRDHELLCNAVAYFKLKDLYEDEIINKINDNDVAAICAMLSILSTQAEAYHSYMHEPTKPPLDVAELLVTMNAYELAEAKLELMKAINRGLSSEPDPDEEIDLVLAEKQKKTS